MHWFIVSWLVACFGPRMSCSNIMERYQNGVESKSLVFLFLICDGMWFASTQAMMTSLKVLTTESSNLHCILVISDWRKGGGEGS